AGLQRRGSNGGRLGMISHRFYPKLNKRRVLTHEDFTVYAVNAYAVRDVAQSDEEFGNFATHDEFPNLVPKSEVWISEKTAASEGVFFIANALKRMKAKANGTPEDEAYDAGIEVERFLRERLSGIKFRNGRPHRRVPPKI